MQTAIQVSHSRIIERLLLMACVLVMGVILTAGLWPFNPLPANQVAWAPSGEGLWFGDHGVVMSAKPFAVRDSADGSCSLALWLEPDATYDTNVVLDFYTPENPLRFRVRQDLDDLRLARNEPDRSGRLQSSSLYLDHTFRKGASVLIGISASPGTTSVYLNGKPARVSSKFGMTSHDLQGLILIGNPPQQFETWGGLMKGLALYNRALTAQEMRSMFETWKPGDSDGSMRRSAPAALYLFNEGTGTVVHDRAGSGVELWIPNHFRIVDQFLLQPFWEEFRPSWSYWKDVAINIAGFVPLGLTFGTYFTMVRRSRRSLALTLLLGFATSLFIEVSQAFIPVRSSGTTDLITNTFGTALGALLGRVGVVKGLLALISPDAEH